jgi:POT family proton-dependent oligopeptide transporter
MFFEQAGSSFTFLADEIVNRNLGGFVFPPPGSRASTRWPSSRWRRSWRGSGSGWRSEVPNPSIPRKFGLGLLFNGLAFLLLMFALSKLVAADGTIPFWTLVAVYVIQSVGELCLSPIGLSMVTKLAPVRLVGLAMGGWFVSVGIGNNLSGIFASVVSGTGGMTTGSALSGYTFGFWALIAAGLVLFVGAPLVNKLMHGVK